MEKSLYQAPSGIDSLDGGIEIEVENPESMSINIGGVEIDLNPPSENEDEFDSNLAEFLDDSVLATVGDDLIGDVGADISSRKDWVEMFVKGLDVLGMKYEERTQPWNGACGVFSTILTEAAVRFQSETIIETFPAGGPVKTEIIGAIDILKEQAAARVSEDMNYQLTEEMPEYRPEHERMLFNLGLAGSAFKKVYYDPSMGRQVSMFIPAEDIILPYGTTDLDNCYRLTHVMRKTKNEIVKLQQAGFYLDIDLPEPSRDKDEIKQAKDKETGFSDLNDDRYTIYEVHVDLDLKGFEDLDDEGEPTGIALPYVMTMIKGTNDVLAIRRNWNEDDDLRLKRQHFVHYQYIPGFGAYGFGLFHLIGGFAKSATSIMRQLIDAGTLSNLPGGLKSRGLRIKGDDTPIQPGEFRDVDIGSGALRDNILPLPYKEPSQVLAGLLGTIVEEGRRFAATADSNVSDMSANAPVGSTLALLERQLKVMTAIQARLHYTFKQELGLLAEIIKDYTDPDYDYKPEKGDQSAKKTDYDYVEIIPVSDPNAATMSQRVVQYQAVIQMAQMAPDIYDMPQLHRRMLEVLGIKNAEKLVKLPEDQKPMDPVTENMAVLKGEPIKAFFYQDHDAHIQVHMSFAQDPSMAQLIGQNPRAPQITGALMAHIAEHAGFKYRQQIEQQLGISMPPEDEKLPPQIELSLSTMMAQAAQQVLQQNQAQAAQQQAQQQAQDPLVQLQQQELQLKQGELQLKSQEVNQKYQIEQAKLQLEEKRFVTDAAGKADANQFKRDQLEADMQLKGTQIGAQIKESQDKQTFNQEHAGIQIGAQIAKDKRDQALSAMQSVNQLQKPEK
jgi:hypothetical protein